jgi:N-acetylglucosamine-6-phosphate deacetylase
MRWAIVGARVVGAEEWPDGILVVEDGRIADTGAAARVVVPPGAETLDAHGLTLLPGFLDVHVHGGGGADTMDATPDALGVVCRTHAAHGTTGLLATTITQSRSAIAAALANARAAQAAGPDFCPYGAQVLGIHLEGPYISPYKPGAQPKEFVRNYDAAEFDSWLAAAGGALKLITLAPEQPGADALIAACRAAGIVVSLGHTNATAKQTRAALEGGAAHATHLFNAMPPIHHREPGPIPVLLTDDRVRVELIADGEHVAPEVIRLAVAARGVAGVLLITDAIRGAGRGDGDYDLGGHIATVRNGRATLPDGTLAGSVLTMDVAAANVRRWGIVTDWPSLARVTSTNAADEMGWPAKGRLRPGADADLVLVDDNLTVHATFVAGRCVYRR